MILEHLDIEQLKASYSFRNRTDLIIYLILRMLSERNEPTGSLVLKIELDAVGIDCGIATIGRYLKELDARGFTRQQANMGRVLTDEGRKFLEITNEQITRDHLQNSMAQAVRSTQYDDLLDLYLVRRGLEIEAARQAAVKATEEEIERMVLTVKEYWRCIHEKRLFVDPSLDFHVIVAEATKNKFMEAFLKMLIYEQKQIESKYNFLVTREYGVLYAGEHEKIIKAIKNRDSESAGKYMENHINSMINTLNK
ncbi:MAG: FCD domain-containing protein [Bacillota bacterium]|nr:FCD domain-containing protein [Bacillota bacterium]